MLTDKKFLKNQKQQKQQRNENMSVVYALLNKPEDITNISKIVDESYFSGFSTGVSSTFKQILQKETKERIFVEGLLSQPVNRKSSSMIQWIKRNENIKTLKSFKEFPDNWDGEGAEQFDQKLIDKCIEIINSVNLKFQPDIFPTGRDSIQFEYEKSDGEYLELEVFQDHIDFYYENPDGTEFENENANWGDILNEINKFHA